MEADRKNKLAIRTVLVSYQAAVRHARNGDRERLRQRALEILDVVAVRIEPEGDPQLQMMLEDARRTISVG